ncbi:unnamed protein product [Ceutorhynchus assimilis]|uniref:Uncharacterized protein n=1 Tax=Ceutorhynchus assimilis TaxID=467358 RepID=A0A9N9QM28_9CUCU|nr:unnamed protein product [Ceutorhynchus assimilis]
MISCNCLNIVIDFVKHDKVTTEALELSKLDKADIFFNHDQWYLGKLLNVIKVHPGLIRTRSVGLWNITYCLNCDVQTHAIHKEKGATYVLVHTKLLNEEAINNLKSSDLVSTIYNIVVNPNAIGLDNSIPVTYHNKRVDKCLKDLNDIVTECIRKEQVAVEERIKKYSDEQYELLNILKDKAYKEREALVRVVQNAARENGTDDLSPKSPKAFGNLSSVSRLENPLSPKKPKGTSTNLESDDLREDLMFDFETEVYEERGDSRNSHLDDSDSEGDLEEAEVSDVVTNNSRGLTILRGKSTSSSNIAKSCPVDIPIFSASFRSKNSRSEDDDGAVDLSPKGNEQFDMAASIKALARSVHGDTIFGELPRPKFSTLI